MLLLDIKLFRKKIQSFQKQKKTEKEKEKENRIRVCGFIGFLRELRLGLSVAAAKFVLLRTSVQESGGRKKGRKVGSPHNLRPRIGRKEERKEGRIVCGNCTFFSCVFVYCGCVFFFLVAVADCEGFWSKEDGGLRDFLVLSVAGSGSHW